MDAFVSGDSVVLPSGSFAANPNSRSLDWDSADAGGDGGDGPSSSAVPVPPGPRRDREAALAERTSDLMSSYERYISGTADLEAGGESGGGGGVGRDGADCQAGHEMQVSSARAGPPGRE